MVRHWLRVALVGGAVLAGPVAARAEVRLSIANGHVSLEAKDATLRQILDEWARVGQTKFVNVERLTGSAMTLQLTDMPEAQALDILLRSASGYLLAPRAVAVTNASQFDRILVMPTSTPPRSSAAAPATPPTATFPPPFPGGMPPPDALDDDPMPGGPPGANPNPRGPSFPWFPGASPQGPGGIANPSRPVFPTQGAPFPPQASPFPVQVPGGPGVMPSQSMPFPPPAGAFPGASPPGGMPVGVSVPGMMVQPPQATQPAQLEPQ